jgi:CIC family chloride channel protein
MSSVDPAEARYSLEAKESIWSADWHFRLLALALGVLVGVIGTAFRLGAKRGFSLYARLLAPEDHGLWYRWLFAVLSDVVIVSVAVFATRRFAPEAAGSGVQEIEGTLAGIRPPLRWARVLPVKFFAGLLAMSAGLVLGREGPTIHIGGCLGAALASWKPMVSARNNNVLIGAGSAAGLAVAFNAPIGGILFALEEIRREFPLNPVSAQGVALTTVTAIVVSHFIAGPARILPIQTHDYPTLVELEMTLPFAMIMGAYGLFLNGALLRSLDLFRGIVSRVGWLLPTALTGAVVSLLVWLFPDATGGGEELVLRLLRRPRTFELFTVLLVARMAVFNVSYAIGAPGGLFFPLVAFGAISGLWFADFVRLLLPGFGFGAEKFAVAGMAALLGATIRAPLTGLALVIDMTGSYQLLLMALFASIVADLTAGALGGRPIYQQLLDDAVGSNGSKSHA